jgi:hypothetical protein
MAIIEIEDLGNSAIASSLRWFESRLKEECITLDGRCALQLGIKGLLRHAEKAGVGLTQRLPSEEVLKLLIQATSADTLSKVLHWGERAGLSDFRRHWQCLNSGNPLITSPSAGYSQDRTKTWELVLASLCRTFCDGVHDVEPPDIVNDWRGKRIGIAAKMLFKPTKKAFCSCIKDGLEQVQRSAIDGGIVAINLADVFPHEEEFKAWHRMRYRYPSTLLFSIDSWVGDFLDRCGPTEREWKALLSGKTKVMAMAFFLPTVVTYWNGHYPVPAPFYRWGAFYVAQRETEAEEFLKELQDALQKARSFKDQTP